MVRKMVLAGFLKRRQWHFLRTHVRFPAHPLQTNGGPLEPPAPLLHERGAVRVALAVELALPFPVVEAADADPAPLALHPGRAPVW